MTQETTIDVQKAYWWTQNKRGDWRAKYRRTSVVKRCAYLTYRSLILDAITQADFWPDDNARYVVGPDYRLGEPSTEKGVYHITIRIEEEEH